MFAKATNVGFAQRVVATLVACAVLLWSIGAYSTAQAANLTSISDVLSDSDVSVVSNHTITFTIPTGPGVGAGETITVTFPAGFNMGSVAFADIDLEINSVDQPLLAAPSGGSWGAVVAGQVLTFTSGTGVANAGEVVEIQIGTNAAGPGVNQITNPTAGSYEISVTAGTVDSGKTRVAIIDNVLVTAIVNTVFDFTITGTATGTSANGTSTTGSTTPTEIPFGVLTAGEIKTMSQVLNVTTNAANGYVVTVETDQQLTSSNGADIDGFRDGAFTDTPEAWGASPLGTLGTEDTYGHWGLSSSDGDLQGAGSNFLADQWVSASTTPRAVMAHNSVSDGVAGTLTAVGDDVGSTTVAYQIEITPLQEAADDYNATLTYIATPTF